MRKYLTLIISIVFMITLVACGDDDDEVNEQTEEIKLTVDEDEKIDEDQVVAKINGVEITGETYNIIYVQTKGQLQQFGEEVEDLEALKEQVLDLLVEEELVMQDASEKEITVSEEKIDTELEDYKEANEEQLQVFLEEYQLSEDAFKDQLRSLLIHEEYLELPEMDVSDEEVADKYEELKEENDEIPELDAIQEQVRMGIKQDKLKEKAVELKEEAEIELFLKKTL